MSVTIVGNEKSSQLTGLLEFVISILPVFVQKTGMRVYVTLTQMDPWASIATEAGPIMNEQIQPYLMQLMAQTKPSYEPPPIQNGPMSDERHEESSADRLKKLQENSRMNQPAQTVPNSQTAQPKAAAPRPVAGPSKPKTGLDNHKIAAIGAHGQNRNKYTVEAGRQLFDTTSMSGADAIANYGMSPMFGKK